MGPFRTVSDDFRPCSDVFGRWRTVSDRFRIVSFRHFEDRFRTIFRPFLIVFGLFSNRFRTVLGDFGALSDRFRTTPLKIRNLNYNTYGTDKFSNFKILNISQNENNSKFDIKINLPGSKEKLIKNRTFFWFKYTLI